MGPTLPAAARLLAPFKFVDEKGKPIVVHGFRTTYRGWAVSEAGAHREVCEAALDTPRRTTVAAYLQTKYLDKRVPLIQAWGDYVLPPSGSREGS